MRKLISLLLILIAGVAMMGCEDNPPPTLPPSTPGGGFIIATFKQYGTSPPLHEPSVEIDGGWQSDLTGAMGDPNPFTVITNTLGVAVAAGKRAPANWKFTWVAAADDSAGCDGQSIIWTVYLNDTSQVECLITGGTYSASSSVAHFTMSPNPVYIISPPSSGTITGNGLSTTYGMPLVQYYKLDGTFVGQDQATSVASGGTSMQIPGFNISQLPTGTYLGFVSNAGPNGTWNYLGTGSVLVVDGSVKITGSEKSISNCTAPVALQNGLTHTTFRPASYMLTSPMRSASPQVTCPRLYDSGAVEVTVNGFTVSVAYGQGSTTFTVANAIASAFNGNSASPVVAYPMGLMVAFQKKVRGTSYSFSATSYTDDPSDFAGPSFHPTTSGPTM